MTAAPTETQPSLGSQPASRRRIALNFLGLAGSNVLGLVVTIAISVYVCRVLGPEAIGQVSWAMAAVAWLTVLVSPGGLTSKIHARVDAKGLPVRLALKPGEAHDHRLARSFCLV